MNMDLFLNDTNWEGADFWLTVDNLSDVGLFESHCCSRYNSSQQIYLPPRQNVTAHLVNYETLRAKINNLIIPLICLFGVIGNSFSIYAFSRRWLTKCMDQLERSATAGLISLALSDFSFCLVSLPALFFKAPSIPVKNNAWNLIAMYYSNYRGPLMNLFLLNSTWIIVLISLERFIAVSYAIKARWMIRVRVTISIHATVVITSIIICLPLFLRNRMRTILCPDNTICYFIESWSPLGNEHFKYLYKVIWTSIGTFIPLLILVISSVRLLVDLYRSKAFGMADPDRYCTPQITTMITAILLSFIALVCPSMIVECLGWLWFAQRGGRHSEEGVYHFWKAIVITNLLQAIKFASNFLLYCAISREFRKTFDFRRLRDSLRDSLTSARKRERKLTSSLQRTMDASSTSACQLITLHTSSQEIKDFEEEKQSEEAKHFEGEKHVADNPCDTKF